MSYPPKTLVQGLIISERINPYEFVHLVGWKPKINPQGYSYDEGGNINTKK